MKKYYCDDCGVELNEGEGSVFTCCETCWNKHYKKTDEQSEVKVEPEVKPEIAEIKKENKKFKEAIKKIYQAAVCGNNNIGKWGLEEYCYNLLNDSSFTA